jgi:hypothetical protein
LTSSPDTAASRRPAASRAATRPAALIGLLVTPELKM